MKIKKMGFDDLRLLTISDNAVGLMRIVFCFYTGRICEQASRNDTLVVQFL